MRLLYLAVVLLAGTFLTGCSTLQKDKKAEAPPREIRGAWITNVASEVLYDRESIAEAMDYLASININVVYPVVWNKAATLYPSEVMEREFDLPIDPMFEGRDPLAEIIFEAHRRGMEVVPWFEFGFSCSYNLGGGPIIEQRPEWAALDQHDNLVKKNNFEWMNALDPEVQNFMIDLIMEVVENYDIDGIQGDDRLPAMPTLGGYDPKTVARYRAEFGSDPPKDIKDPQWVQWRADILNDFLERLYKRVKESDPNVIVSMSPNPYDWCLYEYLQDPKSWMEQGIVDTLHIQAYRRNMSDYATVIDGLAESSYAQGKEEQLAPGILIKLGSYRIDRSLLLEMIEYNRERGIPGEVFFFYPGLRDDDNELGEALRSGPYKNASLLPYRESQWRPKATDLSAQDAVFTGSWQVIDGAPEYFLLDNSLKGEVSYEATVPTAGYYDVYARLSEAPGLAEQVSYNIVAADGSAEAAIVNQASAAGAGWVYIKTVHLTDAPSKIYVRSINNNDGVVCAGPLTLVINRQMEDSGVK